MNADEPPTPRAALSRSFSIMDVSSPCASSSTSATLKRAASPSGFEREDGPVRKRLKEDDDQRGRSALQDQHLRDSQIANELSEELQCGCCSELVYRPVLVMPCQHFFCGSCCTLWIRNGGTNCPACRGRSDSVVPFRALQGVTDMLVRLAPEKARTERERQQADEVYTAGTSLTIPSPKERSPEPDLNMNRDLAHPCPHCLPNNPHGWRCPRAIPDPIADPDNAWHLDEGNPPGHGNCANCENLLALEAPSTSKCDFCQLYFCGINVMNIPPRCAAIPLVMQHPHGFSQITDLIESSEIYDSFEGNTYEVEIVFDYLRKHDIMPRHIYCAIINHMQQDPRQFISLVESEVFSEIHNGEPVPQGPFNRICRACASDVLLWGLKDWWIRERQKGLLDETILKRPNCVDGSECPRQKDTAHARQFNHLIGPKDDGPSTSPAPGPLAASSSADLVANMVVPQTQSTAPSQSQRTMSNLSFLLNESDTEEAATLPTIARVLESSVSDLREVIDPFTP